MSDHDVRAGLGGRAANHTLIVRNYVAPRNAPMARSNDDIHLFAQLSHIIFHGLQLGLVRRSDNERRRPRHFERPGAGLIGGCRLDGRHTRRIRSRGVPDWPENGSVAEKTKPHSASLNQRRAPRLLEVASRSAVANSGGVECRQGIENCLASVSYVACATHGREAGSLESLHHLRVGVMP